MNTRHLKHFLVGAAFAGLAVPSVALADPTCAYIIGHVDSYTVATPAVAVVVPDSDASVQPIRVHLDETGQTILGYSVRVPGVDAETDGQPVFVPGVSQDIPSISATLPELNLTPSRCVNVDGVSTPAVPVYIPASALTLPGGTAEVGGIIMNIVGHPVTAPGQLITFDGKTIVIPEREAGVPSVPVGTPDQSITVDVNGTVKTAHYLTPNS
ncbi:hypothetical protein JQX13_18860 [Archangium violaceum]|uniref:hypothetical protein n=1 Tax=Archangium violaceum TaxID=83451 RepID=UPI00193B483E|nr:hypothetical protein [Archangium violaceum]QRK11931.1 hypothetical protein JQX13_18860 [Archangium violaceum]